jgi:hypothetical protein
LVEPLRKQTLDGRLYTRPLEIEKKLQELIDLPRDELAERCSITTKTDPNFIPSECLAHLVRATRSDNSDRWFEILHNELVRRILARLPCRPVGGPENITAESVRENALGHFLEKLMLDRQGYCDWLDFFEIRFDAGMKRLRHHFERKAFTVEKRYAPVADAETGEVLAEVEAARGFDNPLDSEKIDQAIYRNELDAAIAKLPPEQKEIMVMLKLGFPIESKDPNEMSIVKALGCVEKTVRNRRDRAYIALRAMMLGEDQ